MCVSVVVPAVCEALAALLDAGTPVDVLLDATVGGTTSEAIKSLARTLESPTVAMTFASKRDIE